MAKIEGPLLSLAASGSINSRLVYSQRPSGQQVRIQKPQVDVTTTGRTTQRNYFIEAYEQWNSLSPAEQKQWNDFVKTGG